MVKVVFQAIIGTLFPSNVQFGDIVAGLPVPDASAAGVYCSHVLEHLPRNNLPVALRNTRRILRGGGLFRLVLPDLHWRAAHYLASTQRGDPNAADQFMDSCLLGRRTKDQNPIAFIRGYYGMSAHLWMYDFEVLKSLLQDAGFSRIRRCEFGDSADEMFGLVETKDRFFENRNRELAIEAVK